MNTRDMQTRIAKLEAVNEAMVDRLEWLMDFLNSDKFRGTDSRDGTSNDRIDASEARRLVRTVLDAGRETEDQPWGWAHPAPRFHGDFQCGDVRCWDSMTGRTK